MTRISAAITNDQSIYAALELSKNSWLLAIQVPGRDNPSLHPIKGGDAEGLMAKLDAARQRVAKVTGRMPPVTLCYEAGYDGFWLARLLGQRGIGCLVMEPASLKVNRRTRRVKTDRIDVENILHTLIAWCRGEYHVCSMVVIPSVEEEDLRRSHRERDRLIRERTAHINRIKGLLFGQGIRGINVKSRYKTLKPAELVTADGRGPFRNVLAGRSPGRSRDWPWCRHRSSRSSMSAITPRHLVRRRSASATICCV